MISSNSTNCSSIYYLCYLFIRVQLSMKLNQCAGMIEKKSVFESLEIRKKSFCATIEIQIIVHHMQVFFSKHWCVRNKRYSSFPTVETTQMRISLTTGSQNGVSATQLNGVQLQRSSATQTNLEGINAKWNKPHERGMWHAFVHVKPKVGKTWRHQISSCNGRVVWSRHSGKGFTNEVSVLKWIDLLTGQCWEGWHVLTVQHT